MNTPPTTDIRKSLSKVLCAALVIMLAGIPTLSYSKILEEIVVTAQKRQENLQDIPISVTALSGEQIEALGMTDFTDITQQIPGLQLSAWSPNLTTFRITLKRRSPFTWMTLISVR